MEGENFGTTGTSVGNGSVQAEAEDQISLSVFGSSDMGLGLATEEHTFSFVTLLDSFPFLAIFFCNLYFKISRKSASQ